MDIRSLFTPAAIKKYLKALPPIKTPVMDLIYPHRPQHPMAIIGVDLLTPVVHALPFVRRGAPSVPATGERGATSFYEPFPVRPNSEVTGTDLNNLKQLSQTSKEVWAQGRADLLRRAVRITTEAICAQSLTGKISWPVQMEAGGFDMYELDFGDLLSVNPAKKWDDGAKVSHVYEICQAMEEKVQEYGYGGTLEIWAGKKAYSALFAVIEEHKSTAKIRVEISDQGINVGGYLIKRRSEKHRNPETKVMNPVVADKELKLIATDAGHFMPYCALDDLDGNLQPLPMLVKPVKLDDPSIWRLIGEAKPFPVPNVKGVCRAEVVS